MLKVCIILSYEQYITFMESFRAINMNLANLGQREKLDVQMLGIWNLLYLKINKYIFVMYYLAVEFI